MAIDHIIPTKIQYITVHSETYIIFYTIARDFEFTPLFPTLASKTYLREQIRVIL